MIDRIADDVGRLRRGGFEGSAFYAIERIADAVEVLDGFVCITAGELVRRGVAVEEALALCDDRKVDLLRRMRDTSGRL